MEQVNKQTIENVQRYFEKKIEDCDFELISFEVRLNSVTDTEYKTLKVRIDSEYVFVFSVLLDGVLFYGTSDFMKLNGDLIDSTKLRLYERELEKEYRKNEIEVFKQKLKEAEAWQ